MVMSAENWDRRYASDEYVFGTDPSPFLVENGSWARPGGVALSLADGEGRNGVWLAERGMDVLALDWSEEGLRKASRLASTRGVSIRVERADMLTWAWPVAAFDLICAANFHLSPVDRDRLFGSVAAALRSDGVLVFEGIHKRTRDHHDPETLYDETLVDRICPGLRVERVTTRVTEGDAERGRPERVFMNVLAVKP